MLLLTGGPSTAQAERHLAGSQLSQAHLGPCRPQQTNMSNRTTTQGVAVLQEARKFRKNIKKEGRENNENEFDARNIYKLDACLWKKPGRDWNHNN